MIASLNLHIPTLLLILGSVTIITTILIVSAALFSEKSRELRLWGQGNVSICFGILVGGMSGLPEFVHGVLSYGFVGLGLALLFAGLRVFVGRKFSWKFVIAISIFSCVGPSYFSFLEPSLAGRLFSSSLYFGFLNILCAATLIRPSFAVERGAIWISSGGFIAMGFALFGRASFLIYQNKMEADLATQVEAGTLFLTSLAQIWIAFALVFMITSRYSKEMQRLSMTDSLTGVYNRNGLNNIGTRMLKRAEQRNISMALLVFDADHFKKINDVYGHIFGDEVLRLLAQIAQNGIRVPDILTRFGGEEFILILDTANKEISLKVAERICKMISDSKFTLGKTTVSCTISMGVACTEISNTYELPKLIELADKALYAAKEAGRNRVCLSEI